MLPAEWIFQPVPFGLARIIPAEWLKTTYYKVEYMNMNIRYFVPNGLKYPFGRWHVEYEYMKSKYARIFEQEHLIFTVIF